MSIEILNVLATDNEIFDNLRFGQEDDMPKILIFMIIFILFTFESKNKS